MEPQFNIDRPKISDEEINKHKDFERLLKQFKEQSLQKAKHDKSWWKSKKVRYTGTVAGVAVVCTVTLAIFNKQKTTNETLVTQNKTLLRSSGASADETGKPKQGTTLTTSLVKAPSSKLNIPYTSYKVDNAKGAELKHPTSSSIKIPKNSFVNKNGQDVIGEVTIEYREFHDHADVIASGIPMGYDSANVKYNLESAGMFDIRGNQNGEPVFIKDGKKLEVNLASNVPQDKFNQYYLDTTERNWKYLKRDNIEKPKANLHSAVSGNKKLETLKREIEVIIPKKIDSVKVVYTQKTQALPKPKEPLKPAKPSGKQTFNIDADPKDFPELASFNNLLFELGEENKNYSPEMNQVTWHDVKIAEGPQKGKNYILILRHNKRVEKLVVYPVLSGVDFEKAQGKFQQKYTEYKALQEKRLAEEERLVKEMKAKQQAYLEEQAIKKAEYDKARAALVASQQSQAANDLDNNFNKMNSQLKTTRIFEVAKFGIYNSDCPRNNVAFANLNPIFITDAKSKPLSPDYIYLVDHTRNTVANYDIANVVPVQYDPGSVNTIVVFVRNKIYVCNKNTFKQTIDESSNKFTMSELKESANNVADLRKALEI